VLHRGAEKRRDPNELGMGRKMPTRINSMVPKVKNQMAKGRGEKYQFFS
jgi:hypothetical protein